MPEGHTIHRVALDHQRWFAGQKLRVTSPQGRFRRESAKLSGRKLCRVTAHGKHLFYHWTRGAVVHVHLGLYGKFRVHRNPAPEPRGEVRVRMVGRERAFDLNGPNCCELIDTRSFDAIRAKLGEDPLHRDACSNSVWDRFTRSRSPIGSLLLNQSIIAGIGNIYRAEILFLARIHPQLPGKHLNRKQFDALWEITTRLMKIGVKYDQIITVPLGQSKPSPRGLAAAERLHIYKRDICPSCGSAIQNWELGNRKMYACLTCQTK